MKREVQGGFRRTWPGVGVLEGLPTAVRWAAGAQWTGERCRSSGTGLPAPSVLIWPSECWAKGVRCNWWEGQGLDHEVPGEGFWPWRAMKCPEGFHQGCEVIVFSCWMNPSNRHIGNGSKVKWVNIRYSSYCIYFPLVRLFLFISEGNSIMLIKQRFYSLLIVLKNLWSPLRCLGWGWINSYLCFPWKECNIQYNLMAVI